MVIIMNMDHAPEVCSECPCFVDVMEYGECCVLSDKVRHGYAEERLKYCPLVETIFLEVGSFKSGGGD